MHDLGAKAAEAADAASLVVADLLVTTVIAVASDEWPRKLLSRVRMVADRIKPALTVEPEFLLRDDSGTSTVASATYPPCRARWRPATPVRP